MNSWATTKHGAFESAEVFAQPPHKSRQFLAVTALVTLSIALGVGILIIFFNKMPVLAMAWILLVPVTVLGSWIRTLIVHKRLHELYVSGAVRENPAGDSLDLALRGASSLSYWGTCGTAAAGIAGLAAVIQLIGRIR